MRRRRPFRRPGPPPPQRGLPTRPLPPRVLRDLRRAEALWQAGRAAEAAAIWEKLGQGAARRGWPARAAGLWLRAAVAYAQAGDIARALALAEPAYTHLRTHGRLALARRLAQALEEALHAAGAHEQATAWHATWAAAPGPIPEGKPTPAPLSALPSQCPHCGAPVHPEELTWSRDRRAGFCAYCGMRLYPPDE